MLRRLSMVLAATAVMGICMAMVPQKVEAGKVEHRIVCALQGEGRTYIDYTSEIPWKDTQGCYTVVQMGWIWDGWKSAWAWQDRPYRKCHFRRVYVTGSSQYFNFNVK